MGYAKERKGAETLQPAQDHNINKERKTETSVGGGGWGGGRGRDEVSEIGQVRIYTGMTTGEESHQQTIA